MRRTGLARELSLAMIARKDCEARRTARNQVYKFIYLCCSSRGKCCQEEKRAKRPRPGACPKRPREPCCG